MAIVSVDNNKNTLDLKNRFENLISKYSNDVLYNEKCWQEIATNYSGPNRWYHNLIHIQNMLSELREVEHLISNMDAMLFSIFYHDIIYDVQRTDNEHQSALRLEAHLRKTSFKEIELCKIQIEATKHHLKCEEQDTNFLLDLDLSILGKNEAEYLLYSKNIRKEFSVYPDDMYREGRKKVLQRFFKLPSIFKTDYFKKKYDVQARKNLKLELDTAN